MALFNQAVGRLRRHRVLPGVSVLAKQVASVRQVAEKRLYATVAGAARRADASLSADLVALLGVPKGRRIPELERLPALARRKMKGKPLLRREIDAKLVPAAWKKAVYSNPELPEGTVDCDAYVVGVLEQLFRALNRRDGGLRPLCDPGAPDDDGGRE